MLQQTSPVWRRRGRTEKSVTYGDFFSIILPRFSIHADEGWERTMRLCEIRNVERGSALMQKTTTVSRLCGFGGVTGHGRTVNLDARDDEREVGSFFV